MFALLGGIKSALAALAGALVAVGLFWLWNTAIENPRIQRAAMAEGQRIERAAWEIEMNRVRAEADAARLRAQAAIDARERQYLTEREAERERYRTAMRSLEEIIAELEAEDAAETPAGEPARPRVFLDKRLRDALQPLGRDPR